MADSHGDLQRLFKVDETKGVVYGWAIICKINGQPYFDLQGDHIPEDAMHAASVDFAKSARVAKEMHDGDQVGTVVHTMPITSDMADGFGFDSAITGLLIGWKPDDPSDLEKFKNGEFTGFSIGGRIAEFEEVD